jgi:GTPase SAR1 family protein
MAINLKSLSKPTGQRPIIATLFGEGGMGKTTLAAMFPNPVFIRTEDGTASLKGNDNVSMFPLATSTQDFWMRLRLWQLRSTNTRHWSSIALRKWPL